MAGDDGQPATNEYAEFQKEVWTMRYVHRATIGNALMCTRSGLHHPNVVSLHGICLEPLAMVIDLVPDGALDDFLKVRLPPARSFVVIYL